MSIIIQDPNEFIITRKRKKYKFALFAQSPLCFELNEWKRRPIDTIELGAGTGLFTVELARRHPERSFLAVDVKGDRLQKGAARALELGLNNVWFVRARADQLVDMVDASSLESLWLTFADPFPKKRSAGRRMSHSHYLKIYSQALAKNGAFYMKHDNQAFFEWSLEQLVQSHWRIDELTFDLHDSDFDDDYKIQTTYEERWLGEGLKTKFFKALQPHR